MENTELIVSEPRAVQQNQRSMLDLPPKQMVDQVSAMANILSDIIEKQKMYFLLRNKAIIVQILQ